MTHNLQSIWLNGVGFGTRRYFTMAQAKTQRGGKVYAIIRAHDRTHQLLCVAHILPD
jgi:hypothetical protein